jgi:CDP-glucose 4,6-dehydratase
MRSLERGETIPVRNPASTRPWQHVLEPLSGYLQLAAEMHRATSAAPSLCGGFNFGPALTSNRPVRDLVTECLKHWPGTWDDCSDPHAVHEARLLNLAADKAFHLLHWRAVWPFETTIERTVNWYRRSRKEGMPETRLTQADIADYTADARHLGVAWAL